MKKSTKAWLITAASLIFVGIVIFGVTLSMLSWDFGKLSTVKYETNTHEITEDFKNLSINTDTADLILLPSEDEKCKIVCHEEKKLKHSVTIENETLRIDLVDSRKWYDHITILSFNNPKITVYLPKSEYTALLISLDTGDVKIPRDFKFTAIDITTSTGDIDCLASAEEAVKIKTSTGDISVANISAGSLDLSVSTGDIKLSDITCGKLISTGSTGDLNMTNVIATDRFDIKRSTGDVKFDSCDATEIFIETDTGEVKGSLLTEKVFITNTDTGRVEHPKTASGGRCEITTNTGDININIK